jgi:uncharacterized protein YbbC (DUF1343 family)
MDPISLGILTGLISNACFKVICDKSALHFNKVKQKFDEEIKANNVSISNIDDLNPIITQLEKLPISEDDSPKKIEKIILADEAIKKELEIFIENNKNKIKSVNKTVNINNSGSGIISFGDINQ